MRVWRVATATLFLATGLFLSACGQPGSAPSTGQADQANDAGHAAPVAQTTGQSGDTSLTVPEAMQNFKDDGAVAELDIEGNDQMKYNKNRLEAKPGQMVRITLKHVGKLPAQSMGHNIVILKADEDPFEFSTDTNEQGGNLANSYAPESVRGRVIALSKMVGGGESTSLEFQAPETPDEYPFLCSFPGHVGMMRGVFVVQ